MSIPISTRLRSLRLVTLAIIVSLFAITGIPTAPAGADDDGPLQASDGEQVADAGLIKSSNGLYIGPDDKIYVASVGGDEIVVMDYNSGKLRDRIGPERGVHGPDDVFVTGDGTIYWTEILEGNVGMLRPNGEFRTQFVGPGVNPITMSDDGRLFTARIFLGDGLYELDPDLLEEPREIGSGIAGLNGFDFGPDGLLYAPLFFGQSVIRLDVDAADPQLEEVASGFAVPAAVKFNSRDELHAVDLARGQLLKVNREGGDHEVLAQFEGTIDNLAFDRHDRIFVAVGTEGNVARIDPDGDVVPLNKAGLTIPGGVAVDANGRLWVADFFSLRGFDDAKQPVVSYHDRFLPPGTGPGSANTVSIDGGNLIITALFGNSVQVIDPTTGAVSFDNRTAAGPTNGIRHGSVLAVSQGLAGNVVNIETGDVLAEGFALPVGLASDGTTLYVSDWAMGTVSAVTADGTSVIAGGLVGPEGLALDGGRLLVVEEGENRVSAIDLESGEVTVAIEGINLGNRPLPGFFPFGVVTGIAIDQTTGSIFVSSDLDKTVLEFEDAIDDRDDDDDDDRDDVDDDRDDHDDDRDDGDDEGARLVVSEGESIQAAIDSATPGTTIVVEGDHVENLWISTDGITLKGELASLTMPDAPTANPCSVFGQPATLICVTPVENMGDAGVPTPDQYIRDTRISGFTLNNPLFDAIGVIFAEDIKIRNNSITNPGCDGIFLIFTSDFNVSRNTVTGAGCGGVVINAGSDGRVANNTTTGGAFNGIAVNDVSDVNIVGNTASDNCIGIGVVDGADGGYGIFPEDFSADNVRIRRNTTNGNNKTCDFGDPADPVKIGLTGIIVAGTSGTQIVGNTANDNASDQESGTAGGIVVVDFPNGDGSVSVTGQPTLRANTATGNSSAAGPLDIRLEIGGEVDTVRNNRCTVSNVEDLCG